jgi:hypothetical protein
MNENPIGLNPQNKITQPFLIRHDFPRGDPHPTWRQYEIQFDPEAKEKKYKISSTIMRESIPQKNGPDMIYPTGTKFVRTKTGMKYFLVESPAQSRYFSTEKEAIQSIHSEEKTGYIPKTGSQVPELVE